LKRHFGGVLVVLADKEDRQFPDACHVQAFMEGAVIDRAVAEKRHGHAVRFQHLEAIAGARGLKDARPDNAARSHHANFRGE